jgi:hypothetical protein
MVFPMVLAMVFAMDFSFGSAHCVTVFSHPRAEEVMFFVRL